MLSNSFAPLVALSGAAALAGCAAGSNNAVETKTAHTLGLQKRAVAISGCADDGTESTYFVKFNKAKTYSCYLTGSVSLVGRLISDAAGCETGKGAMSPVTPSAATQSAQCEPNLLLGATGKYA